MENEGEIHKREAAHTDDGFSEEKLAKQVDLMVVSTKPPAGQIFTSKKKTKTLFQAQKDEEK
jgi:hypothetical protein